MTKLQHLSHNKDRQIRVFISSTFSDMHDERDLLIKKIFPQLRKLCEERAVIWTEVDLRWGITKEESDEGKILPLCLEEIHRCRPYFIGLLGERYGRVPKSISADLLESQPWLKEHLEHSVTELEIIHGVFNEGQMHKHAYFYFRDPKYLESMPEGKQQYFMSDEASGKLVKLKKKIRDAHDKEICVLREGYVNPEQLGEWILEDFTALIDRLYPKDKIPYPLDQEAMRHEAYAKSRRLAFVGRSDLLRQMDEHAGSTGAKPLVLTGESGCGKSALLAEWAARWHDKNPKDLIIQHYTGSTPESADWQGLVRRILSELKRAFNISDELPMQSDALRTAMQDWLVKTAGSRRVVIVLDALNQISSEDASAKQLGWLPFALPTNVRLIVSSLPGESLDALRKRNWKELHVPLFARDDIAPAAKAYFDIFSKRLHREILAKIEDTAAAANPLFLRAVLDELRQFGLSKELENKDFRKKLEEEAFNYLKAPDPLALFNLILNRWDRDFGQDDEYPDLVRRSLCLIACSRFGLSESELLDLLGKKNADGKYEPLPRRPWTPFYLAAENDLAQRAGLLTFGHDYLRAAVQRRYLDDEAAACHFRHQLAGYFGSIPQPTDRKLDELPLLLRDVEQWEALKDLLADLPTFDRMREHPRWKWELHGFWLAIGGRYDPIEVYRHALDETEPNLSAERLPYYFNKVAIFHLDAGRYEGSEQLHCRALEVSESVLGNEHPDTLTYVNNLAMLQKSKGDYEGAEQLYRHALEISESVLGNEHPDTLTYMNNLAELLRSKGDYEGAEQLHYRVMEVSESVLGNEHPDTLTYVNNLALLLGSKGDYEGAEPLFRRTLAGRECVLGKEHPNTIESVNNLAWMLKSKGDYEGAEPLFRRSLEASEHVLGNEHPNTLTYVNNLAALLENKGDYEGAELLSHRALEASERVLGKEHPNTLTIVNNLAGLLYSKGDYEGAESLFRHALEASERVLGNEHPNTLGNVNNLAGLLYSKGDYKGAEPLFRRSLEDICKVSRKMGGQHPHLKIIFYNYATCLQKMGMNGEQVRQRLKAVLKPYGFSAR
ncbi:MAG: tetratricopeptide repeat protein (plasmid) [Candidatus Methanoperedens sp.]|uniref:tetratricopeptide repeat protein n=1 Tax=Candidatus Methanoperedens sp. BLZ2 TaxID=2035255 RepID=UPI000BE44E1F|nr:tetratricopeptide repeat protein [Candidatus Methanoperedens sp. BLZ2]KAB2946443.1 MAG: tetratricopeptide repeat protein [Candidatus Methanoperedens sp.]MBZ0175679.1 tetratricopeptide repeat protein [Candidatus Methanoperedens nitroreducens]WAH95051.1 MAG: tetratricopeptide repeat protein [Candidatus Methanoperedens sp.]WAM22227.1 MAG: tetratricopeptide repeat protein [Candidatus Methanoperedens sp.]